MLTLTILHNIYLSKEQRYALSKGEKIEATGVSVPVWFYQGSTSEPAIEVFCKYVLENNGEKSGVVFQKDGYRIKLPQFPENYSVPKVKDKVMTMDDYEQWYKTSIPASGKDLLDLEDGGLQSMEFKEYGKVVKNEDAIGLMHTIEIKPIEMLTNSLS
jgi:hypothetical protein